MTGSRFQAVFILLSVKSQKTLTVYQATTLHILLAWCLGIGTLFFNEDSHVSNMKLRHLQTDAVGCAISTFIISAVISQQYRRTREVTVSARRVQTTACSEHNFNFRAPSFPQDHDTPCLCTNILFGFKHSSPDKSLQSAYRIHPTLPYRILPLYLRYPTRLIS
jgi:cytochrome c biogenesis factor